MKGITLSADELVGRLSSVWPDLIELVISQPRRQRVDATSEWPRKITARPLVLKAGEQVQFTLQYDKQQTHENVATGQGPIRCLEFLKSYLEHLHLFTRKSDIAVRGQADGSFLWRESRPTKTDVKAEINASHNRSKQYLIPENVPCRFLFEIGVMNREGKVLAARQNKFRQINRFLELVNDVLPHLTAEREIQVVDFGSGKSYLTFALHHLLTEIHGRPARIRGVDLKADVIRNCSRIAEELHCEGLSFHHGDIAAFSNATTVDMMVSLHACDTATDAALAQAVRWNTPVILAVPCCQHELSEQLDPNVALHSLTEHGILRERFAALATDALRANILELCGYQTQIVEFIDLEHTPKNLLIRAVRRPHVLTASRRFELQTRYDAFKQVLGIRQPCLERLLGDVLACNGALKNANEEPEP